MDNSYQGNWCRVYAQSGPQTLSRTGNRLGVQSSFGGSLFFKEMTGATSSQWKRAAKPGQDPCLSVSKDLSPHSLECVYCLFI